MKCRADREGTKAIIHFLTSKADNVYIRVDVVDASHSTYAIFSDQDLSNPPFMVENDTNVDITIHQKACSGI